MAVSGCYVIEKNLKFVYSMRYKLSCIYNPKSELGGESCFTSTKWQFVFLQTLSLSFSYNSAKRCILPPERCVLQAFGSLRDESK